MRLSASGRGFCRANLNEAQEVFLDGHVRAFAHFGGVPGRIRYDNLKAAVVKVLKGRDRHESERFIALRSNYRFDSFFCMPGIDGAYEKGGVEGEVGRFRRRHLVPVPRVGSMAELNDAFRAHGEPTEVVTDRRYGLRSMSSRPPRFTTPSSARTTASSATMAGSKPGSDRCGASNATTPRR